MSNGLTPAALSASKLSAAERRRMSEMDAQDDLRTLSRAEEIRANPERLGTARRVLARQQRLLGRSLKNRRPGAKRSPLSGGR